VLRLLLAALLLTAVAAPLRADTVPRYSQRHVYGVAPGPRAVLITLPGVRWRDLRSAETPNLEWLVTHGAAGLMPVGEPELADPNRTWVTLGAGRSAAGGPKEVRVTRGPEGRLAADIAPVWAANRRAGTRAQPGLLGTALRQHGLSTFVLTLTQGSREEAAWPAVAALMDRDGALSGGLQMRYRLERDAEGLRAGVAAATAALELAVPRYDVVLLSLGDVAEPDEGVPSRGRSPAWAEEVRRHAADELVGQARRLLQGYDGFLALLVPEAPAFPNPVTTKSLGAMVLHETKRPAAGLLYTPLTRWPGIVTAADFAPTLLAWWDIAGESPRPQTDGRVLSVRPGTPAQLDRLDRMLSDHYRWGFPVAILSMVYIGGLLAAVAAALWWRPGLLPRLRAPALAAPLIPVGVALAGLTGTRSGLVYLGTAAGVAAAAALGASRLRPLVALAVAMLGGAAVFVGDMLTGAWLSRTSAYAFPVMTSTRFYGIGNEYMGYLLGMTAIGLGALWQLFPSRRALFAVPAAGVVVVVGAPFWGANWGGGLSIAAGCLIVWMLAIPQPWRRAVPIAAGLLLASIALPAALDLVANGTLAHRSHIGAMAAALLAGDGGAAADIVTRKVHLGLRVLFYTPWTLVLGAGTAAVFWGLLRPGLPVRAALRRRPLLAAGLVGALGGGVVAMLVNDSGVVAGAGAICAALATSIFLAALAPEAAR
jgi:hypothetical protein